LTVAAIIAHADDADMLARCVRHHLAIGVDAVFVSLNLDDPESAQVARELTQDPRVRAERVEAFAPDPFHYFTAAKDAVVAWTDPDWVLFVDSDEYWMPRTGCIHRTRGLREADALDVPVLHVPPIRERDGTIRPLDAIDPRTTLVYGPRFLLSPAVLAQNPAAALIMNAYTKVCARPEVVREVGRGAHTFEPAVAAPRHATCDDLVMLHYPFTTRDRLRRKVARIRARLAAYGDRFGPGQAWHWRRMVELDDAGKLDEEFDRQTFAADEIADLLAQGILTTPAREFDAAAKA
jgi:hypothetical protein